METLKIKKGDIFRTINPGHHYGGLDLIVQKVHDGHSDDGLIFFKTNKLDSRHRRNHHARVWWFKEFCTKIEAIENNLVSMK